MLRFVIFTCLITMISFSADARLNLNKDIPGGTDSAKDGEELYRSFTAENGLADLRRVYAALDSFRKLTDLSRKTMSKEQLRKIGNTGGDIQNIGFDNWIAGVEGAMQKQEYIIKQLEYQLAQAQYKAGKINEAELQKAKKAFEDGERKFQKFWNNFQIVD